MQPLKTTVRPSASSRIGCAPRSDRSMIASRRCTRPAVPSSHSPAPSGPRGASAAPIRSSAARSGCPPGRSSAPKPHTALRPPAGRDGRARRRLGDERVEQPRVPRPVDQRLDVPLHAEVQRRAARLDRPRSRRRAPTRPPAGRGRAGRPPGGGTSSRRARRRRRSRPAASPSSIATVCVVSRPDAVWRWSIEPSVTSGRCWCSVPPRATLSAWQPRQMPSTGMPSASALPRDRDLEGVERRLDRAEVGMRLGAVGGRVEVRAAGQADRPRARDQRRDRARVAAAAARPAARRRARPRARRRSRAPSRPAAGRPRAAGRCGAPAASPTS